MPRIAWVLAGALAAVCLSAAPALGALQQAPGSPYATGSYYVTFSPGATVLATDSYPALRTYSVNAATGQLTLAPGAPVTLPSMSQLGTAAGPIAFSPGSDELAVGLD